MLTIKRRRIIFIISVAIFLIVSVFIALYSQGYTLDSNFRFSHKGGLYISIPFSDSEIFVNNKREKATGLLNRGIFLSNLTAGKYSVLVAKDGFWPWAKTLEVKEGIVTEASVFMVPDNPQGKVLLKGKFLNMWASPHNDILVLLEEKNEYYKLIFYDPEKDTFLTTKTIPSEDLLTFSKADVKPLNWAKNQFVFRSDRNVVLVTFDLTNNTVTASYHTELVNEISLYEKTDKKNLQKIWWDPSTNEIYIDWLKETPPPYYLCADINICQLPVQILSSHLAVRNIDFIHGRRDIVMVAVGNGIYALEIDARDNRLLYPIYKGKEPTFGLLSKENVVYILDNESLIRVLLE